MSPEPPWQPDAAYLAALPEQSMTLLSPAGRYHLMCDEDGQWWHLRPGGAHQIDAGQAAQLRPSDVDQIIKVTMIWAWRSVVGNQAPVDTRVPDAIDHLAAGIKTMIVSLAYRAGAGAQ